jgi:hypothetical protein
MSKVTPHVTYSVTNVRRRIRAGDIVISITFEYFLTAADISVLIEIWKKLMQWQL